jgi:DNA-binding response OmpR family regulator
MEMEALGYEVVCAHNRDEALRQMQRRYFDVAVVDVVFPDVNGADFLKEISTNHPNHDGYRLPIIINTAYPYAKNHIKRLAADAFVLKSSDLKELLGKIHLLSNHVRKTTARAPVTYRRN